MNWRNRLGIYGCYLCGTAGIGFTLPYLPVLLGEDGLSDHAIGWVCTVAALSGVAQFPLGVWSDHLQRRQPFLVVSSVLLTISAALLLGVHSVIGIALLMMLFAENGVCRALIDSLSGAEVIQLSEGQDVGATLGKLRMFKPLGIIAVALFGSLWTERFGVRGMLLPVLLIQALGVLAALLIQESFHKSATPSRANRLDTSHSRALGLTDPKLWTFIVAMVLFHAANAPGGIYLSLLLKRDLQAGDAWLAYCFIASMVAWMTIVYPGGKLADRVGRRPLLITTWILMSLRLLLISFARSPVEIVLIQLLDGASNGLFSVVAGTWVTDRLADARRNGEAQVIVGTSLVAGSAIGPAIAAMLVEPLGYRPLFLVLSAIGATAAAIVTLLIPETLNRTNSLPLNCPAPTVSPTT